MGQLLALDQSLPPNCNALFPLPQGATVVRIIPANITPATAGYANPMNALDNTQMDHPVNETNGTHFNKPNGQLGPSELADLDDLFEQGITNPHIHSEADEILSLGEYPQLIDITSDKEERTDGGRDDQLSVPQTQTSNSSSSASSLLEDSVEDAPAEFVGSVQVTEWNVEHILKLREDEGSPTLPEIAEEDQPPLTEPTGPVELDGCRQDTASDLEERLQEPPSNTKRLLGDFNYLEGELSSCESSGKPSPEKEPEGKKDSLEDSLNLLNFDTPLPIFQSKETCGASDWWADALAETQNITEDFDALVEKMDEAKTPQTMSQSSASRSQKVPDFPTYPKSMAATADLEQQLLEIREEEEEGSMAGVMRILSPRVESMRPTAGSLKPARSEGSLSESVEGSTTLSQSQGHSRSEMALGGFTIASGGSKKPSKLANRSTVSSSESLGSIGKGRKSTSRTSSRSPSPSRLSKRRNSPLLSDKSAYVAQAGKLISQGLAFERGGEFEEAFDLMKAAVDVLLNGVQSKWCVGEQVWGGGMCGVGLGVGWVLGEVCVCMFVWGEVCVCGGGGGGVYMY